MGVRETGLSTSSDGESFTDRGAFLRGKRGSFIFLSLTGDLCTVKSRHFHEFARTCRAARRLARVLFFARGAALGVYRYLYTFFFLPVKKYRTEMHRFSCKILPRVALPNRPFRCAHVPGVNSRTMRAVLTTWH